MPHGCRNHHDAGPAAFSRIVRSELASEAIDQPVVVGAVEYPSCQVLALWVGYDPALCTGFSQQFGKQSVQCTAIAVQPLSQAGGLVQIYKQVDILTSGNMEALPLSTPQLLFAMGRP